MDVEMEKKILNLCGKEIEHYCQVKKNDIGDMERLTYLTEFLNWRTMESPYGKNLVMM